MSTCLFMAQVIWVCVWLSMGQHVGSAQLEAEHGLSDPVAGSSVQLLHRKQNCTHSLTSIVSDFRCQIAVAVSFA